MTKFSRFFFWFVIIVLAAWQLPWAVSFFSYRPEDAPFVLYSNVIGDFAMITRHEGEPARYADRKGNVYAVREFDSILPCFYARQLYSQDRFPDSICGRPSDVHEVIRNNFVFRSVPSDINREIPGIYFLMESMSGRVDLEMPDDAFRLTSSSIEFIDMDENRINEGKSRLFTDMMLSKGFVFPALCVSGNPTVMKEYDQGYILVDSANRLYHMKMMRGRPYFRHIDIPSDIVPQHVFINEFASRSTLAMFTDTENGFYVVSMPGYEIRKVNIPAFDPEKDRMMIIGNMDDWTICIESDGSVHYYAVSARDFSLLSEMEYPMQKNCIHGLRFTSADDKYVKPRFY